MTYQIIPLPNNKIAVVGWVIQKKSYCDFVAIVDYSTNSQKIIWQHNIDKSETDNHSQLFRYTYQFKNGKSYSISTMPYQNYAGLSSPPKIDCQREIIERNYQLKRSLNTHITWFSAP